MHTFKYDVVKTTSSQGLISAGQEPIWAPGIGGRVVIGDADGFKIFIASKWQKARDWMILSS